MVNGERFACGNGSFFVVIFPPETEPEEVVVVAVRGSPLRVLSKPQVRSMEKAALLESDIRVQRHDPLPEDDPIHLTESIVADPRTPSDVVDLLALI